VGDLATAELLDALRLAGCPLCRVLATDERDYVRTFWRESRLDAEVRRRFVAGGGFCQRHAWLLHRQVAAAGAGAAVADLYGMLVAHDLAALERGSAVRGRRRKGAPGPAGAGSGCLACSEASRAADRKTWFLVEALREPSAREAYAGSEGACRPHLDVALEIARARAGEVAEFLLKDARSRLAELGELLGEFRRRRDQRYADLPPGREQSSWTEAIRRYVGDPPDQAPGPT